MAAICGGRMVFLLVALALSPGAGRSDNAQGVFPDVPPTHWAYDAVNQLAAEGMFTGNPDQTFSGKRGLTRYEFAVVIQRMLQGLNRGEK